MTEIVVTQQVDVGETFIFAKNEDGSLAIFTPGLEVTQWLTKQEWDQLVSHVDKVVFGAGGSRYD